MIKVLIVEDSPVIQELLQHIIDSDPNLYVAGIAGNGEQALEAVQNLRPDVITMDILMPKMDGMEATKKIMATFPTPIVIVSGSRQAKDVSYSFQLFQAGALAIHLRPPGIGHPDHESEAARLRQTLKLMAEIKVVKRTRAVEIKTPVIASSTKPHFKIKKGSQLIAIGVSTGGPPLIQKILSGLPEDFPAPLVIVQHMAPGFIEGFAEWLSNTCNFPISIAKNHEKLLPGHGYLAPDNFQMGVGSHSQITLSDNPTENGLRPSVGYLFRSIAKHIGSGATGILLTGMGKDGAIELKMMKDKGAITIAQDEASSIVHGMPGEAIRLGAATYIMTPEKILRYLLDLSDNVKNNMSP